MEATTYLNTLITWKKDIAAAVKARDVALITEALKVYVTYCVQLLLLRWRMR